MRAVALRLEGPLQSWGGPVAGNDRPTLDAPTKSGALGLVAGAMGIFRGETARIADLHARLLFAVRVDQQGSLARDFHTTEDVPTAEGKIRKDPVLSRRSYFYDGSFVVLLVARNEDDSILDELLLALRTPQIPLFLGRRACVLSERVLALNSVIEGENVRALFDQVPLAERSIDPAKALTVWMDAALAEKDSDKRALRRQRDVALPLLPRLFGEREIVRVTTPIPQRAQTIDRTVDSVDGWMP